MTLQTIIFDFDGVIIDSEAVMRVALHRAYSEVVGSGEAPIDAYLNHMGESFVRIMDHLGLPRTMHGPYLRHSRENAHLIQMYPQARELLEALKDAGMQLALLTGKDRDRTIETLQRFELRDLFDVVLTSDDLTHAKPHPEGIHRILAMTATASSEAVMIGDAVNDVLCAQAAGVPSIAVTWGIQPHRLSECQPDQTVMSFTQLRDVLETYGTGPLYFPDARVHS